MFSVHKYNKQIYISTILLFPTGGTEIYRENQLPDLAKLLSNSPLLGRNVGQSFDNPLIETKIFNWRYESYCK